MLIEKGSYSTDDGFEPFTNNTSKMSWDGSVVCVDSSFGSGGSTKSIVLDLSSNDKTYINDKFNEKDLE